MKTSKFRRIDDKIFFPHCCQFMMWDSIMARENDGWIPVHGWVDAYKFLAIKCK